MKLCVERNVFILGYVEFNDKGYEYFDTVRFVLFNTDDSHNNLFEYITKDLSRLPKLLEQYISKRLDTNTFEMCCIQCDDNELIEIEKMLISTHPYYKYEYKKTIIQAIGGYLNTLIQYSIGSNCITEELVTREWYIERFKHLTQEVLSKYEPYPNELTPEDFFISYESWIRDIYADSSVTFEEKFLYNVPFQKPIAFISVIDTQKTISNMLYFILDIAAPDIGHLATSQRVWLYGNIFQNLYSQSILTVTQQLSFFKQPCFRDGDRTQESEYCCKLDDIFSPLYVLNGINVEQNGIPVELLDKFHLAVEFAEHVISNMIYGEYKIDNLYQLLYLEIISMIQHGIMIRKCKNCGTYFVVKNRNTVYCERINEYGQSCSIIGPKLTFKEKMNNEECLKIYNRAYKTHFARFKKGKMTRIEFDKWCIEAKKKLIKVRAGKLELSTFQEWLKK